MTFTIALIGRPNVGKSTLFNRMARKKLAIVHDRPGVTRDWKLAECHIYGHRLDIIDTAGLEDADAGSIEHLMRQSTDAAIARADLLLFMIDGRAGLTPVDEHFASVVRKSGKKTLLLINKCESFRGRETMSEAYTLGLGDPMPVSAEHGDGMSDLFDTIVAHLPKDEDEDRGDKDGEDEYIAPSETALEEAEWLDDIEGQADYSFTDAQDPDQDVEKPLKVAIVGRPNAGKSTLMNALLGHQRVITGPQAGLTRDSIIVDWEYEGRKFKLVDTAGLRRKSRIVETLEKFSADESLRNIRLGHVVVLLIDATLSLDKQDLTIASHVLSEGRGLIVALNKWDSVAQKERVRQEFKDRLERSLAQLPDVPFVAVSALTGKNLEKLMREVLSVYENWNKRVGTGVLNRWISGMVSRHPAPLTQGRPNRIRYITQINTRPPTFAVWVSRPKDLPPTYKRYLVKGLKEDFGIEKVPVRLVLRTSKNPYVDGD